MTSKYETIENKKYRRKVRAVVANQHGEVLLIQPHSYDDNQWTYVGGGIEDGESPEQAVQREILEEVGINSFIQLKKSAHTHRFLFSEKAKLKRGLDYDGQSADIFWVQIPSNSKVYIQTEEVKAYKWVKESEIHLYVTIPAQLEVFQNLYEELMLTKLSAA